MQLDPTTSLKTCSRCAKAQPFTAFHRDASRPDGYYSQCRACKRAYLDASRESRAASQKIRRAAAKEKIAAWSRAYYQRHREEYAARGRKWQAENRERLRISDQRWRDANRDKWNAYSRAESKRNPDRRRRYRIENADKVSLTIQRWRRANTDKSRAYSRRWSAANKHKVAAKTQRRRAAEGSFTGAQWQALCAKYGNRCLRCGAQGVVLTVDHVVPLIKGGTNWITDVQPLCQPCNSIKGVKVIDYRPSE